MREGPGLFFENIKDYPGMPLVANIMYTEPQLALALNGDPDWANLRDIIHEGMQNRTATNVVPTGPVKDVKIMGEDVDLDTLPTPRWHEEDGGRYIGTTAGFVTPRSPDREPQHGAVPLHDHRQEHDDGRNHGRLGGRRDASHGASNYGGAGDRNGATHVLENEAKGLPTHPAPSCWAWTRS